MPRGTKRRAAIEGVVGNLKKNPVRTEMVMAILLSLIECGRVPVIRYNSEGEATTSATASPPIQFSLPWTGAGNNLSLPQGQSLIMVSRDPTLPIMFYDYNNLGAAGAAQTAVYTWQSSNGQPLFLVAANQAQNLTPCWATPASGGYSPHGLFLASRTYGDRTYMQMDAPPQNTNAALSKFDVTVPNQVTLKVGDIIQAAVYRLAEGADILLQQTEFTVAANGTGGVLPDLIPEYTDLYRVRINYTPAAGNTALNVSVQCAQTWACGTLCCQQLPQVSSVWGQLNRLRILGANVDVINNTPSQFRGGSVVAAQVPAGTSPYLTVQGIQDPYAYVSTVRQMSPRDFGLGYFGFVKPDGDESFAWQRPYKFDANNNVLFNRSKAEMFAGYLMIAISAPDLVSGTSTTTTRGQVTLNFNFSVEIDSKFGWFGYDKAIASEEEWEIAEEAMTVIPQHWDDPDWGKIWGWIKSAGRIGGSILSLIPDPRAQTIGRATTGIVNVLDRV